MLNNTTPIKPININQRTRLWYTLNPRMHNPQIVVKILPQDREICIGEDLCEDGGVGVTALGAKRVVLG